ncbi:MAG: hypothetical protein HPY66_1688 [Firmicutes bacterium]|nr:hypothetical protein [Bacillota bacterium]
MKAWEKIKERWPQLGLSLDDIVEASCPDILIKTLPRPECCQESRHATIKPDCYDCWEREVPNE